MENELSIVKLVLNASIPVQVVMGLLLLASLLSWTIIFRKRALLSQAHDEAENFENSFWKGGDLTALYRQIEGARRRHRHVEHLRIRLSASSRASSRAAFRRSSC